jgi:hypothetical protein
MSEYSDIDIPVVPRLSGPCKGMPVEWWFPEHPPTSEQTFNAQRAVEICKTCLDIDACGEYAIENPKVVGIWGGMSWKQRQRIRVVRERNRSLGRVQAEKTNQRKIANDLMERRAQ